MWFSINKKIPFSYAISTPGSEKNSECAIDAKVTHTGYSLNPAGEIEIRSIITVSAKVLCSDNLEIIDAAFVAAGWAQHGKALLYRFHPDKDRNDQSFGEYGLQGRKYPALPSATGTGSRAISLAEV